MATSEDWRTIQIFLSEQDFKIYEVELESESRDLRCNCKAFTAKETCKHVRHVSRRMGSSNHFKVSIPDTVDEGELKDAIRSPEKFRAFIIKYGKIEVI